MILAGVWKKPSEKDGVINWIRKIKEKSNSMQGKNSGYIVDAYDETFNKITEKYGSKFEKLRNIKSKYDPKNLFHNNLNIKPDN